ncbi:MAG TPA: SAM-dependent methyltransferase [Polyangiaceae bacterium]|nr:SAM-dependent methyltransferase [Polyangiaceae bacterium]
MTPLQTAAPIAKIRAAEADRPEAERLFTDPYAKLFADAAADVTALFSQIPFFEEHVRLRTRYIDDAVRAALARGTRAIVLVGAGFDTRGLRMTEVGDAGARVIEVDHDEQLSEKRRRLAAVGVSLPPHVVHAPADLATEGALARALAGAGAAPTDPTLFVCEGLFGYLPLDALVALSRATAGSGGAGSRLLANHTQHTWSTDALVKAFEGSGWTAEPAVSFVSLHERYLGKDQPAGGEAFAFFEARK